MFSTKGTQLEERIDASEFMIFRYFMAYLNTLLTGYRSMAV